MVPESVGCKVRPSFESVKPFLCDVGRWLSRIRDISMQIFCSLLTIHFLRVDRATSSGGLAVRNKTREASYSSLPAA